MLKIKRIYNLMIRFLKFTYNNKKIYNKFERLLSKIYLVNWKRSKKKKKKKKEGPSISIG